MTKREEVITMISIRTGDTKKASREFLDVFINIIREKLIEEKEVEIGGLGTFRLRKRGASKGRNLQTGEKIEVPELNAIYFKPDDKFKRNVNI